MTQAKRFGRCIIIDDDPDILLSARLLLRDLFREVSDFQSPEDALRAMDTELPDVILLDIGISSDQLASSPLGGAGRGFSFQKDEPLDMRMSSQGFNAKDVVNSWGQDALETIIRGFGEERYAKRIAQAIVEARQKKPIERTSELVRVIESARPAPTGMPTT